MSARRVGAALLCALLCVAPLCAGAAGATVAIATGAVAASATRRAAAMGAAGASAAAATPFTDAAAQNIATPAAACATPPATVETVPAPTAAPLATATATPAADSFTLTEAERAYLAQTPLLTVAYGRAWEPLLQLRGSDGPSGVSVRILRHLTELTGVRLIFVPLETANRYDVLCCVPQNQQLATNTGIVLSKPFLTLPMALVTLTGGEAGNAIAVDDGFRIDGMRETARFHLTYYPGARDCLDAVLDGRQTGAFLNSYAADNLLLNKRYEGLSERRLEGVVARACFAVRNNADPRLLNILNKLILHTDGSEMNDYVISAILENQPINLGTIADRMPPDVLLMLAAAALSLVVLITVIILRDLQMRRARARAAEIATFLEYANKANDDVWELDTVTLRRWRYRVEHGAIARIPITPLTGNILERHVHPDDLPMVQRRMEKLSSPDFVLSKTQDRFECRIDGGAGYRWMRVVFQSMLQNREHPSSIMGYLMDVDDAVRAEEQKSVQLREALAMAEHARSAQSEFTAYLSHEIRSPLNAMLGYLALARNSVNEPHRLTDYFVKSEYAANHLLGLINDVLDMGAITSGRLRIAQNSFDVQALLDTLASMYNALAKNKGVAYLVQADSLPQRYLIGDGLRLKQVLLNIVSNAIKFTPAGGSVTLLASQQPQGDSAVRMCFTVADTGIGMSEAFQRRLFGAYAQQDATIAARFGGNGLGLSIAKNLLTLMGGDISVVSAVGQGTTFTVTLCLPIDTQKRDLLTAQPDSHVQFAGKRLLLVEDNDLNMEIAAELLKQEGGFAIETATNGQLALASFLQSPPGYFDAILMDIRMPVMDGYEATRAIRACERPDARTLPILAMTADAFDEDIQLALSAGMDGHIPKPIDIHHLLVTLASVLSAQKN